MKRVRFTGPIQADDLLVIEKCIGVDEEGDPIWVPLEPTDAEEEV